MLQKLGNWLKRDWHLRLLALVLAIYFWSIQDKPATVMLNLQVAPVNLSEKLVLISSLPQVQVKLSGLQRNLNKLSQAGLKPTLDMSKVRVPGQQRLSVSLQGIPQGVKLVSYEPKEIIVDIDRRLKRTLRVQARVRGKPAAGYKLKSVEVQPETASLEGPERFLSRVDSLGATIDVTGLTDDLITSKTLQAVDADMSPVEHLEASPSMAQFVAKISPAAPFSAKIKLRLKGKPAKGVSLKSAVALPDHVTVALKDGRVHKTYVLETEAIDLTDKQSSFVQQVKLRLPKDIAYISSDAVKVEVKLSGKSAAP